MIVKIVTFEQFKPNVSEGSNSSSGFARSDPAVSPSPIKIGNLLLSSDSSDSYAFFDLSGSKSPDQDEYDTDGDFNGGGVIEDETLRRLRTIIRESASTSPHELQALEENRESDDYTLGIARQIVVVCQKNPKRAERIAAEIVGICIEIKNQIFLSDLTETQNNLFNRNSHGTEENTQQAQTLAIKNMVEAVCDEKNIQNPILDIITLSDLDVSLRDCSFSTVDAIEQIAQTIIFASSSPLGSQQWIEAHRKTLTRLKEHKNRFINRTTPMNPDEESRLMQCWKNAILELDCIERFPLFPQSKKQSRLEIAEFERIN